MLAFHNTEEAIAKLPTNRQNAASEGEERKRSVVTTLSLGDEAIAPRREGGWDESFAITSNVIPRSRNNKWTPRKKPRRDTVFPGTFDSRANLRGNMVHRRQ